MSVSILMTPGPVGRNFGKQENVTPGWGSQAALVIRERFGEAPITLYVEHDLETLRLLQDGESVAHFEDENFWKKIADAVEEHGAITITMEY